MIGAGAIAEHHVLAAAALVWLLLARGAMGELAQVDHGRRLALSAAPEDEIEEQDDVGV